MPEEGIESKLDLKSIEPGSVRARRSACSPGRNPQGATDGGKPRVRRNIPQLIRYIADVPQIDDIALTTNGFCLPYGGRIKSAGLKPRQLSLDSFKEDRFRFITRVGNLDQAKGDFQGVGAEDESGENKYGSHQGI
jgi:cyclic pyranopterin phosphate synthase